MAEQNVFTETAKLEHGCHAHVYTCVHAYISLLCVRIHSYTCPASLYPHNNNDNNVSHRLTRDNVE